MQELLQCPAEARAWDWLAYTFPCSRSGEEMLAMMDLYSAFLAQVRALALQGPASK